jgi:glucan phosphoethanolaminetransferase (alkaline phosphatase superfamily)
MENQLLQKALDIDNSFFDTLKDDIYPLDYVHIFGIRAFLFPILIAFVIALMIRINCLITKKLVKVSLFIPVFFITLYIINSFMAIDDNLRELYA